MEDSLKPYAQPNSLLDLSLAMAFYCNNRKFANTRGQDKDVLLNFETLTLNQSYKQHSIVTFPVIC